MGGGEREEGREGERKRSRKEEGEKGEEREREIPLFHCLWNLFAIFTSREKKRERTMEGEGEREKGREIHLSSVVNSIYLKLSFLQYL